MLVAVLISILLFTGCAASNSQRGNQKVGEMSNVDEFTIGKTTLADAYSKLGETFMIFDKENGSKKYVWEYTETEQGVNMTSLIPGAAMLGVKTFNESKNRKIVALFFDKNDLLIKKEFNTGSYVDADVAKRKSDLVGKAMSGYLK